MSETESKHIVVPRKLFELLIEHCHDVPYDDAKAVVREAIRFRDCGDPLLCDTCGMVHADDQQALSESCPCGRFKQRMDWARLQAPPD